MSCRRLIPLALAAHLLASCSPRPAATPVPAPAPAPTATTPRYAVFRVNSAAVPGDRQGSTTSVVGTIGHDSVALAYESRGGGPGVTWSDTVRGDLYDRCTETLSHTIVAPAGDGAPLTVSLTDAAGKVESGAPANADEWTRLLAEIGEAARRGVTTRLGPQPQAFTYTFDNGGDPAARHTEFRGNFQTGSVQLTYKVTYAGNHLTWAGTASDDLYAACMGAARKADLKPVQPASAGAAAGERVDVTVKYVDGTAKTGLPADPDPWDALLKQVDARAQEAWDAAQPSAFTLAAKLPGKYGYTVSATLGTSEGTVTFRQSGDREAWTGPLAGQLFARSLAVLHKSRAVPKDEPKLSFTEKPTYQLAVTYPNGDVRKGVPANAADWENLADDLQAQARAAQGATLPAEFTLTGAIGGAEAQLTQHLYQLSGKFGPKSVTLHYRVTQGEIPELDWTGAATGDLFTQVAAAVRKTRLKPAAAAGSAEPLVLEIKDGKGGSKQGVPSNGDTWEMLTDRVEDMARSAKRAAP